MMKERLNKGEETNGKKRCRRKRNYKGKERKWTRQGGRVKEKEAE